VSAGTTPVAAAQRKAAPRNKKNQSREYRLHKAIGKRTKKKKGTVVSAKVGINIGRKGTKRAPHGAIVTLGTKRRKTDGTGANRGRMPRNDFIKRATRSARPEAQRRMKTKAEAEIEKLANEARTK